MQMSALFRVNFGFFKIYGVYTVQMGLSQCGHFTDKGGSQFFAIVCGRLLWTAPKKHVNSWINLCDGSDATRPLRRDEGVEELHGDPTVRSRPKVWTRGQKWK